MPEWFVTNVADAEAVRHPRAGIRIRLEPEGKRFPEVGVNIRVVEPGQPASLYHSEHAQEDFLVLSGECVAILDGEERQLRAWDFVHCPPGTAHVFVGAGDGPCAILAIGARHPDNSIHYPVDEQAARLGASSIESTSDADQAYAAWGREFTPAKLDWPPR